MSVTLLIIENNVERFQVVEDAVFTVGRSTKNQVVLRELVSSRHHCEIREVEDNGYMLRDLGSRNGTQINGQFERMSLLRKGDKITIGSTHLYFNVTNRDEIVDQLPKHPESPPLLTSKEDTRYEEANQTEELVKFVRQLFETKNLKSALKLIFQYLLKKTMANGGIIRLIPSHLERLEFEDGDEIHTPETQNIMDLLFQELLSQGEQNILIPSTQDEDFLQDQEVGELQSLMGSTICFGEEEPVGFIGLYRDQKHSAFKEEEAKEVQQVLSFANRAIEKFRQMELSQQNKPILQLWKKLTRELIPTKNAEGLKKQYIRCMIQELGAELGAYYEITPEDEEFFYGQNRKGEVRDKADFPYVERAFGVIQEKPKPIPLLVGTDHLFGLDRSHPLVVDLNLISVLVIPLQSGDKLLGVVYFEKTIATNSFNENQMNLAQESCDVLQEHLKRF